MNNAALILLLADRQREIEALRARVAELEAGDQSREAALARLREITKGIDLADQDQVDSSGEYTGVTETSTAGWWETSTAAAFGARKLAELEDLVTQLTDPAQPRPMADPSRRA